jgi:hypothetical protein
MERAQASVELDLDNIEDLFGLVDLECRVRDAEAKEVREALVFLIVETLKRTIIMHTRRQAGYTKQGTQTFGTSYEPVHLFETFLSKLRRQIKDKQGLLVEPTHGLDSILTFNYDLTIEDALPRLATLPDYALERVHRTGVINPGAPTLRVLKVHGSSNWRVCPSCPGTVYVDIGDGFCPQHRGLMPILIVPPTWDKGGGASVLDPVWEAARNEMQQAHRLIIIGYSAPPTDRFFRYLLASAIASNDHLEQVVVVNYPGIGDPSHPAVKRVEARYRRMFTRWFDTRRLDFLWMPFWAFVYDDDTMHKLLHGMSLQ